MRPTPPARTIRYLALALAALAGCSDATQVELLEITGEGVVVGQVYLDLDGSGDFTAGDQLLRDVDLFFRSTTSAAVLATAETDSSGVFELSELSLGTYELSVDPSVLGDSLETFGIEAPFTVTLTDTTVLEVGTSYPAVGLADVLTATPGRRLFTSGIALNPRVNFGDGQVHFTSGSTFLRALDVDRSSIAQGDSVRMLGRVEMDNGRPVLRTVTPFVLIPQAVLVSPLDVGTAEAASADGGALDAALVRIRDVALTDTSTNVDGHFRFWAVDGADSVEVVVRSFLNLNTAAFRPDTVIRIDRLTGLLTPQDQGGGVLRWRILPRSGADVALETKAADVSVSIAIDTAQASLGDTVEVTVVAANAGPLDATLLQVRDTVPAPTTFLSATTTVGSFNAANGIWDIGTMVPGASDTLRVRLEVTDGTPRTFGLVAESLGLTFEVDPSPGNDGGAVALTIS